MSRSPRGVTECKYFLFLFAFYLTAVLAPIVLVHKIIIVFGLTTSACLYVYPLTYTCCDIMAEVYGYRIARKAVWLAVFSTMLFTAVISLVVRFPSPASWPHQAAYVLVLGGLYSIAIGSLVGTLLGSFVNIYIISRWKVLLRGRLFWFRSICSSMVGEAIFTLTSVLIVWTGKLPLNKVLVLALTLFFSKVIYSILMAGPATIIVSLLKKFEGVDVYDTPSDCNPLKLSL